MNQAQQMNESLGEAKGLGKFRGKLEEIENDLNSARLGFVAVGKQIVKAQSIQDGKVKANIDRAAKMMKDAEDIVASFRISVTESQ